MATTKPTTGRRRAPTWTTKTWVRIVVGIVILVYVILFIVLNSQSVKIDFVFFNVRSRLWVGFLVSLVLGGVLGIALAAYRGRNAKADKPPAA